jgi:hypothetical protein
MKAIILGLLAAALFGGATRAGASALVNNVGLSSPHQTITFSEFAFDTGTAIANQFASLQVTFTPSLYYNVQPLYFPTASLANFDFVNTSNPASILFGQNMAAAAFAMQTNPGTSAFDAYLDGAFVESFSSPTTLSLLPDLSHANHFFGFTDIIFNEIRITSGTEFFQIDNLQFELARAPEPGTLALFGLGLAGLVLSRRRKA